MALRETLEQRIADIWQKWRTSGVIWTKYGVAATREREITEEFSAHLARVLLEEAAQIAYAMKDYDKSNTAYAIGDRIRELMK